MLTIQMYSQQMLIGYEQLLQCIFDIDIQFNIISALF